MNDSSIFKNEVSLEDLSNYNAQNNLMKDNI